MNEWHASMKRKVTDADCRQGYEVRCNGSDKTSLRSITTKSMPSQRAASPGRECGGDNYWLFCQYVAKSGHRRCEYLEFVMGLRDPLSNQT